MLQFQEKVDRLCFLGCKDGLERGINIRLLVVDRFSIRSVLGDVQYYVNTSLSHIGYSAYQMIFGANPADLRSWQDGGCRLAVRS